MSDPAKGKWYALRVRPRHEKITSAVLKGKGYSVFLPLHLRRRQYANRSKNVELPLFAGYLFCRFDVYDRFPVLTTPGLIHIVGNGRVPEPVDEHEIESLQKVSDARLPVEACDFLDVGERVIIRRGALGGLHGILREFKNCSRIVLSVTLLRRSVQVEIDRDWIERQPEESAGVPALVTPAARP